MKRLLKMQANRNPRQRQAMWGILKDRFMEHCGKLSWKRRGKKKCSGFITCDSWLYFWDSSFNYHRTGILWNVQGYKVEHLQCHLSLSTCRTTNISVILRLHVQEKSRKSRLQTSDIKVTGHNFLEQCTFAWWMIPKVSLWFCNPSQK